MLTQEQNEYFVRVGQGTPMGELLRRYWHAVAPWDVLEESPTHFTRVLGEDLVLFKDLSGRVGLLADHCSHRGASLLYGRVEERGISCAYHGWLYDCDGNILETPPERNDAIMRSVKHTAYPVQKSAGLYWAYLGPQPAPVLHTFDLWARKDGRRRVVVTQQLDCNWFQVIENMTDVWHSAILHQDSQGHTQPNTTRGTIDEIDHIECWATSYGIMKRHYYKDGRTREHPMLFPNILEVQNCHQINVPVDDTHTNRYRLYFDPTPDDSIVEDEGDVPVIYESPRKDPPDGIHPFTKFKWEINDHQDAMAWETQGLIANRGTEHLASSDRWIVWMRDLFKENAERVRQGQDPLGVSRDPHQPPIDTGFQTQVDSMRKDGRAGRDSAREYARR